MNNQPKFKKGDRVVYCGDKGKVIDTLTQEESPDLKEPFIRVSFEDCCIWVPESLCQIQNDSTTPDMLAIPDDHAFQVEWKPLQPDTKDAFIVSDKTQILRSFPYPHFEASKMGYTHYLTKSDLLKLPFQK